MPESAEKFNSKDAFERIIDAEVSDIDSDGFAANLDQLKISEIVGENASENASRSGANDNSSKKQQLISTNVGGLIKTGDTTNQSVVPSTSQQRKAVEAAIVKRTQQLVRKATKIQNSKKFSAHKLEEVLLEIRQLKGILASLWESTIDQVEQLYRRFVDRSKSKS